jgi:hypothetical protein
VTAALLEVIAITRDFGGFPAWLRVLGGAVGRERKQVLSGVTFHAHEGERLSVVGAKDAPCNNIDNESGED